MSRSRIRILLLFAILIPGAALAQVSPGATQYYPQQRQRPALTGTITVTGVVVNAVTGEPISRALIQLQGMVQRAALTDSDGKFQFDNLPETQAMLTAQKPGYYSDLELRQGAGQIKPTAITANMGSVTVKLTPASVVTGRVTTADGEPVESVRVRLKMRTIQNGRRQWTERSGASTDDDGAFRIGNVQPGTYYMYTDGAARMISASDEAIAPAYYPGVGDISGASPLEVRPGTTTVADLTLRKEKAYRVTGVVTGLQQGQGANVQLLNSGGEQVPVQGTVNPGANTFEVRRVPAGSYILKIMAQQRVTPGMIGPFVRGMMGPGGASMPQTYTGSVPINVSGDLSGVTVAVQSSATIPVVVRTDFTNKQTEGEGTFFSSSSGSPSGSSRRFQQYVMLHLIRTDGQQGDNFAQMVGAPDNMSLAIQNIEPGRYRVEFMQMGSNIYVHSAAYGTTDILRDELVVSGGDSQPINVVVRDDSASLSGTVNCGDVQCWVLVVQDGNAATQPRMTYVNPQGTFQQTGLAPGSYRVYAFDRMDGIEFTNPEAMKAYGARAETVVLSAGQKAQVNVELTKVADQ